LAVRFDDGVETVEHVVDTRHVGALGLRSSLPRGGRLPGAAQMPFDRGQGATEPLGYRLERVGRKGVTGRDDGVVVDRFAFGAYARECIEVLGLYRDAEHP